MHGASRSKIKFVTVMIDAGAFVRKTNMNTAELDKLKKENRDAATKAENLEAAKMEAEKREAAKKNPRGADAESPAGSSPRVLGQEDVHDFVRLELEELLVQAPGATIMLRNLKIGATAEHREEWAVGGEHRSKAVAAAKQRIIKELEGRGKEYREPSSTAMSDEAVEEQLGKESEATAADAKDSKHGANAEDSQPAKRNKFKKSWAEAGKDFIAGILSSTLLKDFHLHLCGLQIKIDTALLDDVPEFDIEFQAGGVEIQHAGLFGEVEQRYERLMCEDRGNDALDYHIRVSSVETSDENADSTCMSV